VGVAKPRLLTN